MVVFWLMPAIQRFDQVTAEWLSGVLGEDVVGIEMSTSTSNWAQSASIIARTATGQTRHLWLKLCVGDTFGRSEVDYYVRDYLDLPDSPLVKCYDAGYEKGVGYHLLLDDLSADYRDRKTAITTLEHGLALAVAIARLHAHHWESGTPPTPDQWDPYFAQVDPGVEPLDRETGLSLRKDYDDHAERLRHRWSDPQGLSLLHGDINPTNVLSPKDAESPVYILDRQPFEWAITYGLAVYDLAYAIVPWWPYEFRIKNEKAILRHWYDALGKPGYAWVQAQADWELSVDQCLHVPIEWCREQSDMEQMRGLWQWQLGNITGQPITKAFE